MPQLLAGAGYLKAPITFCHISIDKLEKFNQLSASCALLEAVALPSLVGFLLLLPQDWVAQCIPGWASALKASGDDCGVQLLPSQMGNFAKNM